MVASPSSVPTLPSSGPPAKGGRGRPQVPWGAALGGHNLQDNLCSGDVVTWERTGEFVLWPWGALGMGQGTPALKAAVAQEPGPEC